MWTRFKLFNASKFFKMSITGENLIVVKSYFDLKTRTTYYEYLNLIPHFGNVSQMPKEIKVTKTMLKGHYQLSKMITKHIVLDAVITQDAGRTRCLCRKKLCWVGLCRGSVLSLWTALVVFRYTWSNFILAVIN